MKADMKRRNKSTSLCISIKGIGKKLASLKINNQLPTDRLFQLLNCALKVKKNLSCMSE